MSFYIERKMFKIINCGINYVYFLKKVSLVLF